MGSWTVARWLPPELKEPDLDALSLPSGARIAYDVEQHPIVLFTTEWSADYFAQTNPKTPLSKLPVQNK